MSLFILGLIVFFGVHLVPTSQPARAALVARLGENGYKIGFSVASLIGFVMAVTGFVSVHGGPDNPQLWTPPVWAKHISFTLMLPALILLVAAYVPSRIHDAAKHPMLAAIKIWALAHLIANGDLAGVILFGSFLAWAVYDRISVKKRGARGPLGDKHGASANDAMVVIIGVLAWAGLLFGAHGLLFGVQLLR